MEPTREQRQTPPASLEPFEAGKEQNLNRGAGSFKADAEQTKALGAFAPVSSVTDFSSIQNEGPVSIPSEGGPDSQRDRG